MAEELFEPDSYGAVIDSADEAENLLGERPAPVQWLLRSYQTAQEWKRKAKEVLFSVNGDSDVARNRVASLVRNYFVKSDLQEENLTRWKKGENVTETVRITPPKINDSDATYVDWVYIADFLLLACISISDELEEENTRRNAEFDSAMRSYRKRIAAKAARELIRRGSTDSDKAIAEALRPAHPDISEAVVKVARKMEKANLVEPEARAPQRSAPMPLYKALYFPSVADRQT